MPLYCTEKTEKKSTCVSRFSPDTILADVENSLKNLRQVRNQIQFICLIPYFSFIILLIIQVSTLMAV
jgi:hypothetical protein